MSQTYHIQWFGLLSERRGIPQETIQHAAITPAELYRQLRKPILSALPCPTYAPR